MSWSHMTDKEFAADIRSRVVEFNDMLAEAHQRDMIVGFRVVRENSRDNGYKEHPNIQATTSVRI